MNKVVKLIQREDLIKVLKTKKYVIDAHLLDSDVLDKWCVILNQCPKLIDNLNLPIAPYHKPIWQMIMQQSEMVMGLKLLGIWDDVEKRHVLISKFTKQITIF